jgi:hypothetical protein
MSTEVAAVREAHQLVAWRRNQLAAAGFTLPLATRIARDSRYDVHVLIELVERGCPAELAVRIMAPVDGGSAA